MHVLMTVNTSWNLINFRQPLIDALLADGHRITAVTPRDDTTARLRELGIKHIHVDMTNSSSTLLSDFKLMLRFRQVFKSEKPDIVLAYTIKNNIYGALASKSARVPFIPNISGLGSAFLGNPLITKLVERLYNWAFKGLPLVFFQNQDDQKLFIERGLVTADQAALLAGSGINLKRFSPTPLPDDGPVFLQIGRLLREKGVLDFVEAARITRAKYPNARFQLLGSVKMGNHTSMKKSAIDAWKDEGLIEVLGEAEDVLPFINAADCIVLASYREGLPRTLLEGAACARPLIATDVAGCREVVDEGENGFLTAVKDPERLAEAFEKMIEAGPARRSQMGQAGRKLVEERFDEALVVAAYQQAITKLTD